MISSTIVGRYDFVDFVTGEPKSFSFNDKGGSTVNMYTRRTVNRSRGVIPVYLGTVNEYTNLTAQNGFNTDFRSIANGATALRTSPPMFETIYGGVRISILDGLPEGITWEFENDEVIFRGRDVQAIPPYILSAIRNPTCENYPVTATINNLRCYFRIRAERISNPELYNSTWLYYFIVRTNWSIIRDAFISNASSTFFSFDQKNFVSGENFINTHKANGYYL